MSKDPKSLLKIAVVDDADFSRKTVVEILEKNDFEVVGQAGNAEDAIGMISSTKANLFLIDVVMPNISGMELAKKLSEVSNRPITIIMMSSLDLENIIIESISNGAIDFIAKPFDADTLIKSVTKVANDMLKETL
ncbi:MAG: two-component system response regulator [Halobacteriovorax sp.]|nr:two-component system response regulator [Halobacteriovorax sp.]|tara:strand:- start:523471 stop:523875 length:405 start_codon:yes stop_codon:yes gene_type:complete